MKKMVFAAAAVAFAAVPASAVEVILTAGPNGTYSGSFDTVGTALSPIPAGSFSHTWTFTLPQDGLTNGTISSVALVPVNDVNLTSVTLNGTPFTINSTGVVEFQSLVGLATMAGVQTLVVNGTSGSNGNYAGTISFSPTAAVPEPATWAMMVLGFGAVGFAMRRRPETRVRFA